MTVTKLALSPAWSPLLVPAAKLPGIRALAVLGIAFLFTLLALHWCERNGRLAQDPTYDDSQYMIDGVERQQVLDKQGISAVVSDLAHHPPHSAFSTVLALASFETFGVHDWAPYAFNGFVLAGFLFLCGCIFGDLSATAFYSLVIFCLTLPLSLRAIHDFRPDLASAVATMGFVWFGFAAALGGEEREKANGIRAGVLLGAALWIKPTVFAHTIAIAAVVGAGMVASSWLPTFRPRGVRRGVLLALSFGAVGIAVASPYYLVNGRQTLEYFTQNTQGADAYIYSFHVPAWGIVRAFVLDGAEALFIGRYLWVLLACCAFGLGWAWQARRYLVAIQVAGLLFTAAVSLAIFVVGRHNSEYFGLYYELLVLAAGLAAVSAMIRAHPRLAWIAPVLALLYLTPVSTPFEPFWAPAPEANPGYGWNQKIVSALVADTRFQPSAEGSGTPPAPVFLGFAGFVSSQSLEWICTKDKLPFTFTDLLLSGDPAAQLRAAREAAYVVVATPDAKSVFLNLPSAKTSADVLKALREAPNFREIKVDTESAPPYRLFRNLSKTPS